jgi:pimeloyl-ACP methyl ester carboxylesterase
MSPTRSLAMLLVSLATWSAPPAMSATPPCAALEKFSMPGHRVQIRQARQREASAPGVSPTVPAHCLVEGLIDERSGREGKSYAIGFAVALPTEWNGRFLFQGGGGLNGSVQPPVGAAYAGERSALMRGFAVASTDSGHQGAVFDASFFRDQQAALNFLYQAVADVTVVAKAIVTAHYGRPEGHAYFVGCSTGGREAMLMSQRFPNYYDGIVAVAPAARTSFSNLGLRHAAVSLKRAGSLSEAERKQVIDGLLQACDGLDGMRDGFVFAPHRCQFDPGTLPLAQEKVEAIRAVMRGPRTTSGRQVYPGYYYDTGITHTQGLPGILVGPMIPEGPPVGTTFDVDAAAAEAMDARAMLGDSSAWTNLSTFRAGGGKLIFAHGVSDPWFSAQETVRYYEALGKDNPEAPLHEWTRLFLVPGMGHCGGGSRALDRFDLLTPLVDWVESARAPDRVIATGSSAPGESRPLCPFPSYARYDGKGDAREAAHYSCRE